MVERIGPTHNEWINELFRDSSHGKRRSTCSGLKNWRNHKVQLKQDCHWNAVPTSCCPNGVDTLECYHFVKRLSVLAERSWFTWSLVKKSKTKDLAVFI